MLTLAHLGQSGASVATHWDPVPIVIGVVVVVLHQRGVRDPAPRRYFVGGVLALIAAVGTPLEAVARSLASAHMFQHMVILLVASPLLAAARPAATLLRTVPLVVQRGLWRSFRRVGLARSRLAGLGHPGFAWFLYVGTLWFWHAARPYQAAVTNTWVHLLEHTTFLLAGVAFWRVVFGSSRPVLVEGARIVFVFTVAMQGVLLAALLTFASTPWYPVYSQTTVAYGLDPLTDQQLAGLLLWVPSGLVFTGVAVILLGRWISNSAPAERDATGIATGQPPP